MSDESEIVEPAAEANLAADWSAFLTKLVPPRVVVVEDTSGKEHKLRASLPAALETEVIRQWETMIKSLNIGKMADELASSKTTDQSMSTIVDALIRVVGDDAVLDMLSDCFSMAHPRAVREAIEAVRADEDMCEHLPAENPKAKHVFGLAELVSGIVPFVLRAGHRMGKTLEAFQPAS